MNSTEPNFALLDAHFLLVATNRVLQAQLLRYFELYYLDVCHYIFYVFIIVPQQFLRLIFIVVQCRQLPFQMPTTNKIP